MLLFLSSTVLHSQDLYDSERVIKMELEFYDSDFKELLIQNKNDKIEIPARLIVDDETILDSVGVRYKGNSSYNTNNDKIQEVSKTFIVNFGKKG